jgi:hypothetical protein
MLVFNNAMEFMFSVRNSKTISFNNNFKRLKERQKVNQNLTIIFCINKYEKGVKIDRRSFVS